MSVFHNFEWSNCELLSIKYRALGAQIGRRVNLDVIEMIDYDLISIGDNCVFGSMVKFYAADDNEALPIQVQDHACVLDNSILMGGVVVDLRSSEKCNKEKRLGLKYRGRDIENNLRGKLVSHITTLDGKHSAPNTLSGQVLLFCCFLFSSFVLFCQAKIALQST